MDNQKHLLFLDDDPQRWENFTTWVDKYLPFPAQVIWVNTYESCIEHLKMREWDLLSLDNDLGTKKEGKDVLAWLERELYENNKPVPTSVIIHTANPVAKKRMIDTLMSIKKKQEVTIDVQSFDG